MCIRPREITMCRRYLLVSLACALSHLLLGAPGAGAHHLDQQAGADLQRDECADHLALYQEQLMAFAPWALQMFDSTTKLPEGLMRGNIVQFGNYDECLMVKAPREGGGVLFQGRHCLVTLNVSLSAARAEDDWDIASLLVLPSQQRPALYRLFKPLAAERTVPGIPLTWSVCAPSTCGPAAVSVLAETTLNTILGMVGGSTAHIQATVVPDSCYFMNDGSRTLSASAWIMLAIFIVLIFLVITSTVCEYFRVPDDVYRAIFIVLILLVISSTAYEYFKVNNDTPRSNKTLALTSFSLCTNLQQLLKTSAPPPGTLSCLNGIRVLSMAWVILGHRYMMQFGTPSINAIDILLEFPHDWTLSPLLNALLSVDTFFFMSGLLTSYVFTNDMLKGKSFNVLQYYVYRYIRLTPPLAIMVGFAATLAFYVTDGPLWSQIMQPQEDACKTYWWATLLYINNWVGLDPVCIGQSWYLSADMQLSWLAPLVLLPLWRWPKLAKPGLLLLTLGSCAAIFGVTYIERFPWTLTFIFIEGTDDSDFMKLLYYNTGTRAVPFLVGIWLGDMLSRSKAGGVTKKLSTRWVTLGWCASTVVCLAVIYTIAIPYSRDYVYNRLDAAFYGALHRLAWSLGLSWIVYACVHGHGGVVNDILSWRMFQPLAKLSYCAYLTHYLIMFMEIGFRRNPANFSHFEAVHAYFADLFITTAFAFALYLAVEAPTITLLRVAFNKVVRVSDTSQAENKEKEIKR